jgi:nicotinamidase-related amidase
MKVLVVIDMQNDFITGSLGTPEARAIVPNVQKKVDEAIKNGDMVVYTRDTHQENYLETMEGKKIPIKHCIEDTVGWEIADEVLPTGNVENVYFVNKPTFGDHCLPSLLSAFADSKCGLNYGDEIELVGLCTDICVVSNALLLKSYFYNDIEISVDATCCAGVTPETHEAALKTMEMCQINVRRG